MDVRHNNVTNNGHIPISSSTLRSHAPIFDPALLASPNFLRLSPFCPANHLGLAYPTPFHTKTAMMSSLPVVPLPYSVAATPYTYATNGNHAENSVEGITYTPYQAVSSSFPPIDPGGYPVFSASVHPDIATQASQCLGVAMLGWNRAQNLSPNHSYPSVRVSAPPKLLPANSEGPQRLHMPVFQEVNKNENSAEPHLDCCSEKKKKDSTNPKTSAHRKGRQPSSDPSSSHAVYARLNRERRKKYIADLGAYRNTMKGKKESSQNILHKIDEESRRLTEEIAALRHNLQKNGTLMALLSDNRDCMRRASD